MVKIIEKTDIEKERERRNSKLVKIAEELLEEKFDIRSFFPESIHLFKKRYEVLNKQAINVFFLGDKNEILVQSPEYLNDAISLAKAYEASGELEFTVRKDYNE